MASSLNSAEKSHPRRTPIETQMPKKIQVPPAFEELFSLRSGTIFCQTPGIHVSLLLSLGLEKSMVWSLFLKLQHPIFGPLSTTCLWEGLINTSDAEESDNELSRSGTMF